VKAAHLLAWTAIIFTPASAQDMIIPPNTLSCDGFTRRPDGNWATVPDIKPFDIGPAKHVTVSNIIIARGLIVIQGVDIWELLNEKCGN
jgi:hypothetical protein